MILSITFLLQPFTMPSATSSETDAYWAEVSRTVAEGDFEAYADLYHEDAILVSGVSGEIYPISKALDGWKQGFDDTKAGKMTASVEFRFSQRIEGNTTAHNTGIFCYTSQAEGKKEHRSYVHFQGLLIKKDGEWKMMMEYQKEVADKKEWEALAPKE